MNLVIVSLFALLFPLLAVALDSPLALSKKKNVIVVGGSSGMGKAAALAALQRGGSVMLVSRSEAKLERAKQELGAQVPDAAARIELRSCDASSEAAVEALAGSIGDGPDSGWWDSLVISCAGKAPHGPVSTLDAAETRDMMESKVWTAYHCAKHLGPKLRDGGSVVLVAGILNRRPGLNCAPLAMANGALEGLARSLALEWGPRIRVNCLSPGFCDTERFDHMTEERKANMMANTAASLPLQRVGQPEDMGEAIYYLLTAPFCTGVVLDVDGGHGIRQYANPQTDPMRNVSEF